MKDVFKPVDYKKLYKLLNGAGTNAKDVSQALGWNRYYIENSQRAGRGLRPSVIKMIEKLYTIHYDQYKPDTPPEIELIPAADPSDNNQEIKQMQIDLQTLTIKHDALDKQLQEIQKTLKTCLDAIDHTYDNTVNMRQVINETYKGAAATLQKVENIELSGRTTAETIAKTSNRTKEILNRMKGYI